MIDTLSLRETAKIFNTSRQNIQNFISRGILKPQRGRERKTDWRITPEVLTEFTQHQINGLIPTIGLFIMADAFYKNQLLSDEKYNEIRSDCYNVLSMALTVDALIPAITHIIEDIDILRELMSED